MLHHFPGMSNQTSSMPVLARHNNPKMMTSKTESSFLVRLSQSQPQPQQQHHPVQHCRGAQGARSTAADHSGRYPEYIPPSPSSVTGKKGNTPPFGESTSSPGGTLNHRSNYPLRRVNREPNPPPPMATRTATQPSTSRLPRTNHGTPTKG